ncbi:MAG: hypothetical protein HKN91_13025 [Acidimicrobiia bacterium]|nr:hypothetical protein [Acidimicrobiia bacterium]
MAVIWGLFITVLALVCWGGQTLALFSPSAAERFGLADRPGDVDAAFYADGRGEAAWDFVTLWTLGVAGVLLVVDATAWAYFGLIGGGMYVYFGGRGVLARQQMASQGIRIGDGSAVKTAYWALSIWGVAGLITLIAAFVALA